MNKCLNCGIETKNPKFCSNKCSATYNHKTFPTRGMKGVCKSCGKPIKSVMRYCDNCKETHTSKTPQYKYIKTARAKRKQHAINLLGGKCIVCGYNRCNRALEFHHINPNEKLFSISQIILRSKETMENELSKCVLLCSNCHMELEDGMINLDDFI